MTQEKEQPKPSNDRITRCCPEFDNDCQSMNSIEATWCFLGCDNHPCNPNGRGIGTAEGYCPMLHKTN